MIKGSINNLIEWLNINEIGTWVLSSTSNLQNNTKLFETKPDEPREKEIERMIRIMDLSENSIVYVFGKKEGCKATVGNYSETWANTSISDRNKCGSVQSTPTNAPFFDENYLTMKIDAAVERERMSWERKELERREAELKEAQKDFRASKEGVMGILVEKAAPFIGGFLQKQGLAKVAGIDSAVEANKIEVKQDDKTDAPFSDEEANKLFEIVKKYKDFDPDYLSVLTKLIEFATSGNQIDLAGGMVKLNYQQIKDIILTL